MHLNKQWILRIAFVLALAVWLGDAWYWHRFPLLSVACIVAIIVVLAMWWADIYERACGWSHHHIGTLFLSVGTVCLLVIQSNAMLVSWFHLTRESSSTAVALMGVVTFLLHRIVYLRHRAEPDDGNTLVWTWLKQPLFSARLIWPLFLSMLLGRMLWLLYWHQSTAVLYTPWQVLPQEILWLFAGSLVIVGIMVFSHFKTSTVLLCLVALHLVTHQYVPLSHTLPLGGDAWRHLAMADRVALGEPILPVLFGPTVDMKEVVGQQVPAVFLSPNKYAYAPLWSALAFAKMWFGVDTKTTIRFLVPLLSALLLPVLAWFVGRQVLGSSRGGLLLAWLTLIPFSLQASMSLSLPVTLGFLLWLLTVLLWLRFFFGRDGRQLLLAIFFSLLMIFSYPLFLLLLVPVVLAGLLVSMELLEVGGEVVWRRVAIVVLMLVSVLLLPLIELLSGSSTFVVQGDWLNIVRHALGQFSGFTFARSIQSTDIASWNIWWNHTPMSAFVASAFSLWRYPVILLSVCTVASVGFVVIRSFAKRRDPGATWIAILSIGMLKSYMIGWFLMTGEHTLIRRLDMVVAFASLLAISWALGNLPLHRLFDSTKRIGIVILLLLFSWIGTIAFASGPDIRSMSADEYAAGSVAVAAVSHDATPCVLADTWPLLAVEYHSHGQIVGGGFPIDRQFGQPARVAAYEAMKTIATSSLFADLHRETGGNHCLFLASVTDISTDRSKAITDMFHTEPVSYGSLLLWQETLRGGGKVR